jgi:hypothetical protein
LPLSRFSMQLVLSNWPLSILFLSNLSPSNFSLSNFNSGSLHPSPLYQTYCNPSSSVSFLSCISVLCSMSFHFNLTQPIFVPNPFCPISLVDFRCPNKFLLCGIIYWDNSNLHVYMYTLK